MTYCFQLTGTDRLAVVWVFETPESCRSILGHFSHKLLSLHRRPSELEINLTREGMILSNMPEASLFYVSAPSSHHRWLIFYFWVSLCEQHGKEHVVLLHSRGPLLLFRLDVEFNEPSSGSWNKAKTDLVLWGPRGVGAASRTTATKPQHRNCLVFIWNRYHAKNNGLE